MVWTILVEGHLREHACLICFNILPLVKEKKSFSGFSYCHLVQTERNGLSNFGRESPKAPSCEII